MYGKILFIVLSIVINTSCAFANDGYFHRKFADLGAYLGSAQAEYRLGMSYLAGNDVPQSDEKALYWLGKSAENGDTDAQTQLGLAYSEEGTFATQDFGKSVYWFKKAAHEGNPLAELELGLCYMDGNGVPKDFYRAAYWLEKSANQGVPNAQCALALLYLDGIGVPQNEDKARDLLQEAEEQGYSPAADLLQKIDKDEGAEGVEAEYNDREERYDSCMTDRMDMFQEWNNAAPLTVNPPHLPSCRL